MALTYTPEEPELGSSCPDFNLPGTDGKSYSRDDFRDHKAFLVMFICNHCPYVIAVEDRLVRLGKHFEGQPVNMIAISANDPARYEEDSFENMKKRAEEKGYPFPYLFDESQAVAKTFGAVCTPDFFLFDKDNRLAYRGRLDDSWKDESQVTNEELKAAIQTLLDGGRPDLKQKPSMGCSIKWKSN